MISTSRKKREGKNQGKFYFIRVREDSYKKIAKVADKNGRSTNNMANLLIQQKLEEMSASGF